MYITAETIAAMSSFQAWEMFVGNQSASEFLSFTPELSAYDSVESYVQEGPLCDDLQEDARNVLIIKLYEYIRKALDDM